MMTCAKCGCAITAEIKKGKYLLSNCTLEGKKVSYDYKLPFAYFVNFDNCNKKHPGCDCLARSRLTGLRTFFSQA